MDGGPESTTVDLSIDDMNNPEEPVSTVDPSAARFPYCVV